MNKYNFSYNAINYSLPIIVSYDKDTDLYIASCQKIDVVAAGINKEDAIKNVIEAITIFIDDTNSLETMKEFLI